jgi:raffinose/stachyose/melibiose transport system substrate-binding protein
MLHPRMNALSLTRFLPAALLVLLLALGAAPPFATAQEPVTLRVWDSFTGPEGETVDAVLAAFMEANSNITIEREVFDYEQILQTANVALSSSTGPDVMYYAPGPGYAGVLADAELIVPLEDLAEEYGWNERIAAAALEQAKVDGVLYGLPLEIDLIGMFANRSILDQEGWEIPETIEEMVAFCGEAREAGYIPLAFSNNPGWSAYHQFTFTSNNMIGPEAMYDLLFNHEGRWDTPEQIRAIEGFFVDLRDAGCFSEDVNAIAYEDGNTLFFNGEAVLHPTGSWLITDIEQAMPDAEIEFVPFPAVEGGRGRFWDSGLGSIWVLAANSQHPEEAAKFLDFLVSPESAEVWAEQANIPLPVTLDTSTLEASPLLATVIEVLNSAAAGEIQLGYNIDVLVPPELNDAMLTGFQAILAGDKAPEEQAANMQAAWEVAIAE